jgi:hypothetical protein
MAGGTIIMPIDISTAATTRSMTRKGRKIRKPTWNARSISLSRNDGISVASGSGAPGGSSGAGRNAASAS